MIIVLILSHAPRPAEPEYLERRGGSQWLAAWIDLIQPAVRVNFLVSVINQGLPFDSAPPHLALSSEGESTKKQEVQKVPLLSWRFSVGRIYLNVVSMPDSKASHFYL